MKNRSITSQYYNYYYRLYKPFLIAQVSGLAYGSSEFDDYMSIAREELMFVLKKFNPNSGSFKSYLRCRVWGAIKHRQDKESKHNCVFSIPSNDKCIGVSYNDNKLIVEEMLDCLDDIHKTIISSYYLDNMTFREIQAATGIPVSTIYVMKNKAIQKIRQVHHLEF